VGRIGKQTDYHSAGGRESSGDGREAMFGYRASGLPKMADWYKAVNKAGWQGMDEMGVTTLTGLDPKRYGRLLAKTLPKVIESDQEFRSRVAELEALLIPERELSAEESTLAALLEQLIMDYDSRFEIPENPPHETVRFLMEQKGLRQADLVPVLGSRAQVSDLVNGRRGISKSQAKKLAQYFDVSAELFL
jgi:HTH-type transcriptional regulator/antitoxin HigA